MAMQPQKKTMCASCRASNIYTTHLKAHHVRDFLLAGGLNAFSRFLAGFAVAWGVDECSSSTFGWRLSSKEASQTLERRALKSRSDTLPRIENCLYWLHALLAIVAFILSTSLALSGCRRWRAGRANILFPCTLHLRVVAFKLIALHRSSGLRCSS
jgi:hypothetical protein